jgi:hypothetical protein
LGSASVWVQFLVQNAGGVVTTQKNVVTPTLATGTLAGADIFATVTPSNVQFQPNLAAHWVVRINVIRSSMTP